MGKNLCPENDISFENSYTIRFEENIPAGTYTISAVVKSEDTDSSVCLMLFYLADGSTKEIYISRSVLDERVFKTAEFASNLTRVRIYASEGYNPSVGDAAGFSFLQIEAGSEMTDFEPYGYTPEPEPEPEERSNEEEVVLYLMALCGTITVSSLPDPTCRLSYLLRKIADISYVFPEGFSTKAQSKAEIYLWDLINSTSESSNMVPQSDFEKYLAIKTGRTDIEKPDLNASDLNTWMDAWVSKA